MGLGTCCEPAPYRAVDLSLSGDWATLEGMVALIIGMLVCIGLALAVVGLVAVPARRDGRDVLTARGEEVVAAIRGQATGPSEGSDEPASAAADAPHVGDRPDSQAPAQHDVRDDAHSPAR